MNDIDWTKKVTAIAAIVTASLLILGVVFRVGVIYCEVMQVVESRSHESGGTSSGSRAVDAPERVQKSAWTARDTLDRWQNQHPDFLKAHGMPGGRHQRLDVWYQFFVGGIVFYNSSNAWSVILDESDGTWRRITIDDTHLISHQGGLEGTINSNCYGTDRIDRALFADLIPPTGNQREYNRLIESGKIVGGIGTLYVREDLWGVLGDPTACEQLLRGALYIAGQYELLVDVTNREADSPESSGNRAVIALLGDGKFVKHPVHTDPR